MTLNSVSHPPLSACTISTCCRPHWPPWSALVCHLRRPPRPWLSPGRQRRWRGSGAALIPRPLCLYCPPRTVVLQNHGPTEILKILTDKFLVIWKIYKAKWINRICSIWNIIKQSLFYNIPVHETVKFLYQYLSSLWNFELTKGEDQMYSSFW